MSSPPPYQSYGAPPQDTGKGPMGLDNNIFSMLCYAPCCIGLVVSIIGIIQEKNNRSNRFHAFQGLFLFLVLFAIGLVIGIFFGIAESAIRGIVFLSLPIRAAVGLISLAVMIYMMIQAYGGNMTKLPVIGDLAEKQAG